MPTIHLTTFIEAPLERVFDLSRHIGLHQESMKQFNEKAVAGTRFGLIEKNENVTWTARHLLKTRVLKGTISEMQKPSLFVDEQVEGPFKRMKHFHHFKPAQNGTIMIDIFEFESPYGLLGKIINTVFLTSYIRKLIDRRNKMIKDVAETGQWKRYLN